MTSTLRVLMNFSPLLATVGLVGGWFVEAAHAEPPPGPSAPADRGPPGGRREPPPFAFTACDGKAAGDTCSVQLHDTEISGTCAATSDDRVFCRPEHMPPPPSGERPPQD
jgi:hypothetical protein